MIFFGKLFVSTVCGELGFVKGDDEILAYNFKGEVVDRIPAKGLLLVLDVPDGHGSYAVCREGQKLVVFKLFFNRLKRVAEANVSDPRYQSICAREDGSIQLCEYVRDALVVDRGRVRVMRKHPHNRKIGWNLQVNRDRYMNLMAVRERGRLNVRSSGKVIWSTLIDKDTGFCWASNNRELILSKGDTLGRVVFNEHGEYVAQFTSHVRRKNS